MRPDPTEGQPLSSRARSLEFSAIRKMFEKAEQYPDTDLVHLEIGEPDFDTPQHIVDAATAAAREGETSYTSTAGIPELREAIADQSAETDIDPASEITVTTGGMEALYAALQIVADEGSRVVVPTPTWPNYLTQIRLAGATPIEVPLAREDEFDLDPERVINLITDETAAIVFSSPSNPTGQVFSRSAVREVVRAAAAHDCYVIADEVYDRIVYGDHATGIRDYTDHPNHVLTVNSCSKTYAMTGWRVGWLTGPEAVVDAVTKLRGYITASPPTISQHAALAALTGPQERAGEMAATFAKRRDYVVDRVADIPHLSGPAPDGAIYMFVDVGALPGTSLEIADELLDEYGVVTAPGEGFGDAGNGYLRLSFANSSDRLATGLDRIEQMVTDRV